MRFTVTSRSSTICVYMVFFIVSDDADEGVTYILQNRLINAIQEVYSKNRGNAVISDECCRILLLLTISSTCFAV